MPSVLSGMAAIVGALLLERRSRPEATDHGPEQLTDPGDGPAFVSTVQAADRLGLSPRTMDRFRATVQGPAFHRFGGRVRYSDEDLEAWVASRQRTLVPAGIRARAGLPNAAGAGRAPWPVSA